MNVGYVIWLENLSAPIIKGQVIELLKSIADRSPRARLHLIAFQPLYRIVLRHRRLAQLRQELKANHIDLVILPCLAPPFIDLFRARWFLMPFIAIQGFPGLAILTIRKRLSILHCRSYPATWIALAVSKLVAVRVIFDPRSDFPEENLTAGRWSERSLSHRAWKRLEKQLLARADVTVAILGTYVEHFRRTEPATELVIIPNNVDVDHFQSDPHARQRLRHEHGLAEGTVIFCYCGSMGQHWHSPEPYARFMKAAEGLGIPHWFLFITHDTDEVEACLRRHGIGPGRYHALASDFARVPGYLSAADFGLILMETYKVAMGVKTVEYLAMGLPVVTDRNTAGAREVIERYGLGLVLESHDAIRTGDLEALIRDRESLSVRCRDVAAREFSTASVAARYIDLYRSLESPPEHSG